MKYIVTFFVNTEEDIFDLTIYLKELLGNQYKIRKDHPEMVLLSVNREDKH